jgi:anti-sigma factor (TIGR02949 family)
MSDCAKYNTLINEYIDGELSEPEAKQLREHLDSCPDCRSYLSLLETVGKQLKNTLEEPPAELKESIMNRLRAEPQKKKQRLIIYGRYAAIAAVFCVVLLGAYKLLPAMGSKSSSGSYDLAAKTADSARAENYGYAADAGADDGDYAAKRMEAPEEGVGNTAGSDGTGISRGYEIYKNLTYEESFYIVAFIYGEVPEEIKDCEVLYTGEGQTHYKVPSAVLLELVESESFDEIHYSELTAKYGLVIIMTEE